MDTPNGAGTHGHLIKDDEAVRRACAQTLKLAGIDVRIFTGGHQIDPETFRNPKERRETP